MMNNRQFDRLLDVHGADLSRWPRTHRAAVQHLIATDQAARESWENARRFDEAIAQHVESENEASISRVNAVLSGPLPRQRRQVRWAWPGALLDRDFGLAWPRLAALAAAAVLGFAVGLLGFDTRFGDGLGPIGTSASSADLSAFVFEPEPLTGLRP